jgi:hypothetical protein
VDFRTIEIDPNAPMPDPPRPRRISPKLMIALSAAFVVGVVSTLVVTHQLDKPRAMPVGHSDYQPRNDDERKLFDELRPATYDELWALEKAISTNQEVADAPGSRTEITNFYVATGDIKLPAQPLGEPVVIGLPQGLKWVSGSLHNVTLVLADRFVDSLELALALGIAVFDPYCYPAHTVFVAESACTDAGRRPATPEQMMQGLHNLTQAEWQRPAVVQALASFPWFRSIFEVAESQVFYASGLVRLAPYLTRDIGAPIIILGPKARIVGGRLGSIKVLSEDFAPQPGPDVLGYWLYDPVYNAFVNSRGPDVCPYLGPSVQKAYPGVCR